MRTASSVLNWFSNQKVLLACWFFCPPVRLFNPARLFPLFLPPCDPPCPLLFFYSCVPIYSLILLSYLYPPVDLPYQLSTFTPTYLHTHPRIYQLNLTVLLSYQHFEISTHFSCLHRTVFFTYQFYRLPEVTTERWSFFHRVLDSKSARKNSSSVWF